jgi:hypothetical protein
MKGTEFPYTVGARRLKNRMSPGSMGLYAVKPKEMSWEGGFAGFRRPPRQGLPAPKV